MNGRKIPVRSLPDSLTQLSPLAHRRTKMLRLALLATLVICLAASVLHPQSRQNVRYFEVGKSARGRSIQASIHGNGEKRVIVLAAIHGDEQATAVVAKALAATLQREPLPGGPTVIIVPEVNPDGLVEGTRVNGGRVDINRNFPSTSWRSDYPDEKHYPGKEPASEPETRAIINLLKHYPPDLLITLHAALGCMNWDGPGEEIAALMARANGYALCPYLGYETPGSLGTYAGVDGRIPTVTIELRAVTDGEVVQENLPALRAALARFSNAEAVNKPK